MEMERFGYITVDGEKVEYLVAPQHFFPSGRQLFRITIDGLDPQIFLALRSRIDEVFGGRSGIVKILPPNDPRVVALREKDPDPGKGDSRGAIPFSELVPDFVE